MKQYYFLVIGVMLLSMTACGTKQETQSTTLDTTSVAADTTLSGWNSQYVGIPAEDISGNPINKVGDQWMLITAGTPESFNTMTAAWGGWGMAWGHPAAFIMVRESRYTYEFLSREQKYTLCFFDESYRSALRICGTTTGRTTDKAKEAGLTPITTPSGLMAFAEANLIIECHNMWQGQLPIEQFTDEYRDEIITRYKYDNDLTRHQLFLSAITQVWVRK